MNDDQVYYRNEDWDDRPPPGEGDDECPERPGDEKEFLFLIEFLVDSMMLKPENMELEGMDPCLLQGGTCIDLTFLHFPPMAICEKDLDPCKQTGGNLIKFNAGKSLMFALSETQFQNPPEIFLGVTADKNLPHGFMPNKLLIGKTKINLVELFKQIFQAVDEKPDKLPISKSIKDKYQLVNTRAKCPTAEVVIYIRLSCLGQNVVTEFQRGGDECEPILYKNKESRKVYECKPKEMPGDDSGNMAPLVPGWGEPCSKECGDTNEPPPPETCCNATETVKAEPTDDDEFEEFGTEVQGHALTIKVQRNLRNQQDFQIKGPGNKVVFQVPPNQNLCNKGKGNRAPVYNLGAPNEENCGSEPIQIVEGEDFPDKDVFVLRIGKKGETYAKGKLELELRTPKPKIERDIPETRKWDKAVQTEKEEKSPNKGNKNNNNNNKKKKK